MYYGNENESDSKRWEMDKKRVKKKIVGLSIIGITVILLIFAFCKSTVIIQPGYTGIQYSLNGGMMEETLGQGFKIHKPWVKVIQYPTSRQQCYLSQDEREGSKENDSFNIPTADGKSVNVDLEFAYKFDAEHLSTTYTEFKGKKPGQIENEFIRAKMKSWSGEISSTFSVIDIYGDKRQKLNGDVMKHVQKNFAPYGIIIDSVSFTRIEPDDQTKEAIQLKINKQQELETAKLEAQKVEIEGQAKVKQAELDANAKRVQAQGEADANAKLQQSITPELLKKMEMEARLKHGWITIKGSDTVVTKKAE